MIDKVCAKSGPKLFALPYINPVVAIKLFIEVHSGILDMLISLIPAFISKQNILSIYTYDYHAIVGGCLRGYIQAGYLVKAHVNNKDYLLITTSTYEPCKMCKGNEIFIL